MIFQDHIEVPVSDFGYNFAALEPLKMDTGRIF
jgi:hypothetical protein